MYIYFNNQELSFAYLKDKPGKKGYKAHAVPKDHTWRRWNQKSTNDKQRNYLVVLLG